MTEDNLNSLFVGTVLVNKYCGIAIVKTIKDYKEEKFKTIIVLRWYKNTKLMGIHGFLKNARVLIKGV